MLAHLSRGAQWLAASGIQFPNGGVARYYRADLERNLAASTEITGYSASAFAYLHKRSGERIYLEHALGAAKFLAGAWDRDAAAMPFELDPPQFSYFFDCGIIARGLLAVWRATGDFAYLGAARDIGDSMLADFPVIADGVAPILKLPAKEPIALDAMRWSRAPGCYQLKAAMAWLELSDATHEPHYRDAYESALRRALANAPSFLPGHTDCGAVMDRLHPFLYFLEGLLPRIDRPECAEALRAGIPRVAKYVDEIGPHFLRADVLAQLLRIRLFAHAAEVLPLQVETAEREAVMLRECQATSPDAHLDGGFYFGRRGHDFIPHVSPVPTVFALQALDLWQRRSALTGLDPVI